MRTKIYKNYSLDDLFEKVNEFLKIKDFNPINYAKLREELRTRLSKIKKIRKYPNYVLIHKWTNRNVLEKVKHVNLVIDINEFISEFLNKNPNTKDFNAYSFSIFLKKTEKNIHHNLNLLDNNWKTFNKTVDMEKTKSVKSEIKCNLIYSDVDKFIKSIVENKEYESLFRWPESISEQFEAHFKIENAIVELNGCYLDTNKWKDIKAVKSLIRNNPFHTKKDVVIEAMDLFFYNWNPEDYYKGTTKETAIKEVYDKANFLIQKYSQNKYILPDYEEESGYCPTICSHCCNGQIMVELSSYKDTGYEIGINHIKREGHSESWEWTEEERKNNKLSVKSNNTNELEIPAFDTNDFWKIFNKEISEYSIAWRNSEQDFNEYLEKSKSLIINSNFYPAYRNIIESITDIIAYNANIEEPPFDSHNLTKYVYNAIFIHGNEITKEYYSLGDSWYFMLDDKQQYMVSVLKGDEDKKEIMLSVVCLSHDFRCYITSEKCESF